MNKKLDERPNQRVHFFKEHDSFEIKHECECERIHFFSERSEHCLFYISVPSLVVPGESSGTRNSRFMTVG